LVLADRTLAKQPTLAVRFLGEAAPFRSVRGRPALLQRRVLQGSIRQAPLSGAVCADRIPSIAAGDRRPVRSGAPLCGGARAGVPGASAQLVQFLDFWKAGGDAAR
jgi:hypothetical protein